MWGLGVLTLHAVKNPHIVYSLPLNIWFLCIRGSASVNSTNCRSCSTVVFTVEKKTTCNWTHTIQTHVVQGSPVIAIPIFFSVTLCSQYNVKLYIEMEISALELSGNMTLWILEFLNSFHKHSHIYIIINLVGILLNFTTCLHSYYKIYIYCIIYTTVANSKLSF